MLPSSRGLGHQVFILGTGVRISLGVPSFKCGYNSVVECLVANENVVGSNPTIRSSFSINPGEWQSG